ncbi:unnamed protein product [Symbiodinium necroappetens]|uniref:Carrier domain-containing protein n=1 Tax=Symbiodinium necroappetens TaxID=1628268 RepID=A0A812S0X9_9DINO|nr:unnamed protein product [Symbiodinium necroappetens]
MSSPGFGMLATLALAGICHADCSETEAAEACVGQHWADSVVPPGFSAYSSLAKCAAATVAGSIFALVGMMIESKKDKKNKPISREDLVLPRTTSTCSSSPVHAPAPAREAECQDSQQQDPDESELKRSQSLPSSQLKRSDTSSSGQRSYTKEKEKGRSDELNWRSTSSRPVRTFSAPVPKPKTVAKPPPSPLSIIGKDLTEMQKVERQVKSILNKLTWEKLDKLYDDLVSYCTVDDQDTRPKTVEVIARDVFKKATLQHHFIELYAGLCARLDADLKQRGIEVNFRRALLEQCQESFTTHLAPPQIDSCLDYEDQYEMLVKYKTKMLGNVKLIAHLLRLRMLAAKIIFHCIDELISIGSAEERKVEGQERCAVVMAPDPYHGLDHAEIYGKKAADESLNPKARGAWKDLADGVQSLNEDDPDSAIRLGNQAGEAFRDAHCPEGDADSLLLVTRALTSVNRRKEADKLARDRLAEVRAKADGPSEAKALLALAEVNADQRGSKKREEARTAAKEARGMFEKLADERMRAAALLVQSHICIKSKNQEKDKRAAEALKLAEDARKICNDLGDTRTEATCLHAYASAHDIIEQHNECIQAAEDALDLYLDLQDPYAEAFELCCMAQWFMNYSRWQLAIDHAEDALEILRAAPKPSASQELRALQILSQAHQGKGDKTGTDAVHESLKRFQQSDNRSAEAAAMDMLLRAHCEKGEFERALETAERARSAFKAVGDEVAEANISALIAGLYLKLGMADEALKEGHAVLDLVRRSGSTKQKSDLMLTLSQAYLEKQEHEEALAICRDMQDHFTQKGDVEGEADCLLAAGSLLVLQGDLDEARSLAAKAQLILSEEGNATGEGKALRLLAEIYAKQEQHKAAIRAGERSRALLRGEEGAADEASMLFLVAQEAVQLAVIEGARVGLDKPLKRHAREALDKAEKCAKMAVKLCTDNASEQGTSEILGSSLCSLSQVHMLRSKYKEALSIGQEAVQVFVKTGHKRNQASASLLCADAERALEHYKESQRYALEAVACFNQADVLDEKGLASAQSIIEALKQHLAPPRPQVVPGGPPGALPPQMMQQYAEEEEVSEGRVARTRERGPAMDVKALSPDVIKKKILDVALSMTGADDGDIEADTPLMEAGLTSTSAVGLRDELMKDLVGVNLPVTLVFDYPSISAMTELALETLCAFIETLGGTFDKPQWSGYARLQEIFKQVEILADDKKQSARTRCLLKDLLDKRRNAWQEKTTVIASPKSDKEKEKLQKKTIRSEKLDWMEARVSVNSPLSGVSGRRAAA